MKPQQEIQGAISLEEPRAKLLSATRRFVQAAKNCNGVLRIALIGSLTTGKAIPKDTDLLVIIEHSVDLAPLALIGRRLQGSLQSHKLGADIFLASSDGAYIGRICPYRECRPRMACRAEHCGRHPYLNDDLHVVALSDELISFPPVELRPRVVRNCSLPEDVELLLIDKVDEARLRAQTNC